jgi:hypothetical protein
MYQPDLNKEIIERGGKPSMLFKSVRSKISSILIFALLVSSFMPIFALGASIQFKDITDSYAQQEIQALAEAGVVSGYEDNTFQPHKAMTRAELAKIIVLSLGLKEKPDMAGSFKDVATASWYSGFVGALVESGITQGTSETTFSPDAKVTREELVVFFIRAFGLEDTAKKLPADAKLSDLATVSEWAQADVSLAFKVGFINGIENNDGSLRFSPKDNAERQALARLAYEFKMNKTKFVDKANELTVAKPEDTTPNTPTGGGGGGGSSSNGSSSSDNSTSNVSVINSGGTINGNVILSAGTYGPSDASGQKATINGTLTLDPGATGAVTLQNVEATDVVVTSGAAESIHLKNVKITEKLMVNTGSQTVVVRVVAEGSTFVAATYVASNATIESGVTSDVYGFGNITINPTSAGQSVNLKGNIKGDITVAGSQSVAMNVYGSVGNIIAKSGVTINAADPTAQVGSVQLASSTAKVSLKGTGVFQNIVASVEGAVLDIADGIDFSKINIKLDVAIQISGSSDTLSRIPMKLGSGVTLEALLNLLGSLANELADALKSAIDKGNSLDGTGTDTTTGTVTGYVYDTASTVPLSGATVSVTGSVYSAITGSNGMYAITVPAGTYSITASKSGYDTVSPKSATVSVGGTEHVMAFVLYPTAATADTTAPSSVTDLVYTATSSTSVTLSWIAATDDSIGTVSYAVYRDSLKQDTVTSTTYNVTGLNPGTSYTFYVFSIDGSGNVSTSPAMVTVNTSVTMQVYAVFSSADASVTSNVYALNKDMVSGYYMNTHPENNYLIIQFSDSLSNDAIIGSLDLNTPSVTGLSPVTTSVYNSVYLAVYSDTGYTTTGTTLNITGLKKTVSSSTYTVDPINVMIKESQ